MEAQGISVEKEATPKKVQVSTRTASLPPHLLTEPESSPSPHKKPRLMPLLSHPVRVLSEISYTWSNFLFQGYLGPRRPSFELRRTMSWTVKQEGPYEGEGQFFLPRNFSTPAMTQLPNSGSTDTSEGSENDTT